MFATLLIVRYTFWVGEMSSMPSAPLRMYFLNGWTIGCLTGGGVVGRKGGGGGKVMVMG